MTQSQAEDLLLEIVDLLLLPRNLLSQALKADSALPWVGHRRSPQSCFRVQHLAVRPVGRDE
jgi:hypothetical protein